MRHFRDQDRWHSGFVSASGQEPPLPPMPDDDSDAPSPLGDPPMPIPVPPSPGPPPMQVLGMAMQESRA
ncbi:MAG: hypothetical protein ACRYGI_14335 [Janthinobacterium lividum]